MNDNYKIYLQRGKWKLYDIVKDKYEEKNIADQKPEIVEKLSAKFRAWEKDLKKSFQGDEYGVKSYTRVKQSWEEKNMRVSWKKKEGKGKKIKENRAK